MAEHAPWRLHQHPLHSFTLCPRRVTSEQVEGFGSNVQGRGWDGPALPASVSVPERHRRLIQRAAQSHTQPANRFAAALPLPEASDSDSQKHRPALLPLLLPHPRSVSLLFCHAWCDGS